MNQDSPTVATIFSLIDQTMTPGMVCCIIVILARYLLDVFDIDIWNLEYLLKQMFWSGF